MPKIFATEKPQADYKHLFDKILPDLQGYDEIHILTNEDFENLDLSLKQKYPLLKNPRHFEDVKHFEDLNLKKYTPEDLFSILGESQLLSHLKSSGQVEQEEVFLFYLSKKLEGSGGIGPHAISIETKDGDKPFRVGLIVMTDDSKDGYHEGMIIPKNLSGGDKRKLSFTKNPSYMSALSDFIFLHEAGHLVDDLKNGIQKLSKKLDDKTKQEWAIINHTGELAADNYAAHQIILDDKKPVETILRNRTITGTWRLVSSPDSHFTEPFMEGKALYGVPFESTIEAGKRISEAAQPIIDKIFKESRGKISKADLSRLDPNNFSSYCINLAVVSSKIKELLPHLETSEIVKEKIDKVTRREINLKSSFDECAANYFDYQVRVLSATRYSFKVGTLERAILDNYMTAVTDMGLGDNFISTQAPANKSKTTPVPSP